MKWEKTVKEMKDRKTTGNDDVPVDILKTFGEYGLKTVTQIINSTYETEKWLKDLIEVSLNSRKLHNSQAIAQSVLSHFLLRE